MPQGFARQDGYLPVNAYGVIGDCRSAALVGADGSIDWLCLPRFDSPSIFGRLLDPKRGGHWQVEPTVEYRVKQHYRDLTNILQTVFYTERGQVVLTDFMPVDDNSIYEHARPHSEPRVVRLIECLAGSMTLEHRIHFAPNYGEEHLALHKAGSRYHGSAQKLHFCLQSTVPITGKRTRITLKAGDTVAISLRCDRHERCSGGRRRWSVEQARDLARETQNYWWQWIGTCKYEGPFQEHVFRSALALKLMTYAPTGAIIAAPTTSLPERIGGQRNWDYRFTWLRDASFTLYAFFQLGMVQEATDFYNWLIRLRLGKPGVEVCNLYSVDGAADAREVELPHLRGYRDSLPVRIGNAAIRQLQLDVYGELLDSAYLFARFGGKIDRSLWKELRAVVNLAIDRWELPDSSIWEVRHENRHYTYSKMMCWVAVDRGLRLAEHFQLPHDAERWRSARQQIQRRITREGFSKRRKAFTQSLNDDALDAAMLRMAQVRFLPENDPRLRSTVQAIARNLGHDVLVDRYAVADPKDLLHGREGAFFLCSFWLADAWAHLGDVEIAQQVFEKLLSFSSPLGLFSEEVDTGNGELLGNFPQAFTHLALIGAAVNIERARHGRIGKRGLSKSRAKTSR